MICGTSLKDGLNKTIKDLKNLMNIVALLTARGNNTLKDKNLLKILDKPLIAYPCTESKKVKKISDYYVSSEDPKILNEANKYNFKIIKRPKNLSKPNSLHQDVLKHSIKFLEQKKIFRLSFDFIG